jgi:hypothetical protein
MARLAVLVDIGFGTLKGSATSVARIRSSLAGHGFEIAASLCGDQVTRDRLAATIASLRPRLSPGDSLVLYFVGHGDRVRDPSGDGEHTLLVTHDLRDPSAASPGIAGVELLRWLTPIADAIDDVTVILDCCRATRMMFGVPPIDDDAQARLDAALAAAKPRLVRKYRGPADAPDATAEPSERIVRLVATTAHEIAVERELPDGRRIGLFTDMLSALLDERRGHELSWDELLPELQDRVGALCNTQRPGVEGPRYRVPFTRRERLPLDTYTAYARDGWRLHAGSLNGIEVGDRFKLDTKTARVVEVDVDRAKLRLECDDGDALPSPVRARRISCATTREVAWPKHIPRAPGMVEACAAAPELQWTERDGVGGFTCEGDALVLRDRDGVLVHVEPTPGTAHGGARMVAAARRLIRWERQQRALASLGPALVHVAWGRAGSREPLPCERVELREDDVVWLEARGAGEHPDVLVSVFHLRADLGLTHLDASLDHGHPVRSSERLPLGDLRITRPIHLPRDLPCDGALLVLASIKPRSLHRMATERTESAEPAAPKVRRGDGPEVSATFLRYRLMP